VESERTLLSLPHLLQSFIAIVETNRPLDLRTHGLMPLEKDEEGSSFSLPVFGGVVRSALGFLF